MITKALIQNGAAKVYILGRRPEKLQEAAAYSPGKIIPLTCDVTSKDALAAAAAQVEEETGFVNLLVPNSGMVGPPIFGMPKDPDVATFQKTAWSWSDAEFNSTYALNNTAVFFTAVAFLHLLDAAKTHQASPAKASGVSPQIVITASIASYLRVVVSGFAYITSKAAAVSLAKALSTHFAPYNIRVNAIAPGVFPSELTMGMMANAPGEKDEKGMPIYPWQHTPARRPGNEEEMAGTILYLASRAGAYCNGNVVVVDGGRLGVVPASY